jgi:fructokinase
MQLENVMRPLIVGEVLFDCFRDRHVLGGAPFNVAWNLQGFGLHPLIITAVGEDELGWQVQQRMGQWGMDGAGLQVLPEKPTGRVDIELTDGQAAYKFWDDVAFDHIAWPDGLDLQTNFGLLYHGSLALRNPQSRETIIRLRQAINCPCFIDVNIRPPHFDLASMFPLLENADHLKLNEHELRILLERMNSDIDSDDSSDDWQSLRQMAEYLADRLNVKNCWLTAGETGAAWLGPNREFFQVNAAPVENLQDTVGAGDALSAVIIYGILAGIPPQLTLEQATQFASAVCGLRGALSQERAFYQVSMAP